MKVYHDEDLIKDLIKLKELSEASGIFMPSELKNPLNKLVCEEEDKIQLNKAKQKCKEIFK